ncbi:DNA-binding transcriptional regulator, AcrR family [Amycolatopsis xylanica]|uniref:DNA-binding transcriptional regulator, AcrR family n=1 Tax=Amycolatopsis xylanica TaxID=589385 RepID=A0A1H2U472_9PSEU|nr:TetR/AcrR family transcriptional regulator [Amycolatopsis xylanica]SDW50737.1 DNA-binding transcriptional regulator, AcrR family [Amycolatopsis xylanica]
MVTKRVRARRGYGALLGDELLRAAEELLIATGSEDAVTVRAVAEAAGVTPPSVYRHFADKEALVEAVCLRVWTELSQRLCAVVQEGRDPFTTLRRAARVYIDFALEHPVQYRTLITRPATGPEAAAAVSACMEHFVDNVAACVDDGVFQGDPRVLTASLWSAVHGCASLLIAQPLSHWPADTDAVIEQTIRMAGFGAALASRLPRTVVTKDLATSLDELGSRLSADTGGNHPETA